jgi:hypothetical protein
MAVQQQQRLALPRHAAMEANAITQHIERFERLPAWPGFCVGPGSASSNNQAIDYFFNGNTWTATT